jgi:hypothetical protein
MDSSIINTTGTMCALGYVAVSLRYLNIAMAAAERSFLPNRNGKGLRMSAEAPGSTPTGPGSVTAAHGQAQAVSVVICAYTAARWAQTCAAVASVLAQRPAPAQVLVVIDHNPGLLDKARRELAGVTVLANAARRACRERVTPA